MLLESLDLGEGIVNTTQGMNRIFIELTIFRKMVKVWAGDFTFSDKTNNNYKRRK